MQVYPIEIKDGLAKQLEDSRISFACQLFAEDKFINNIDRKPLLSSIAKANPNQKDLFYRHSILASVGWNANDDVFDKVETWNARYSPVDKQINFMHNELEIIGHSTSSYVYDENKLLIPDSTPIDKLPDRFDVVTEFVLYSMWDNPDRQNLMEKLVSEISEDKWFVSMECRFPNFDYAIIDNDAERTHKIVARNENTAFLTKHLRAYGGTGEYQGRKIGRLIRQLFFSGQAIVDKPANSRSVIFNNAIIFNSKGSLIIKGNEKMEEELKKQIAELKAQVESFNKKQYEDTIATLKAELAQAEKKCDDMEEEKKEADSKAKSSTSVVQEKDTAIANLTKELKEVNDKLTVANAELASVRKDQAFAARAAKLIAAGLADEEAKTTATKWETLNDAQFDEIVAMHKAQIDTKKTAAEKKEQATEKTEADLKKAEAEVNPALNTSDTAKLEQEMDAISAHIGKALPFSSRARKLEQANK